MVTSTVDAQGLPVQRTEWTSLVPDGRELDYRLAYDSPMGKDRTLSLPARTLLDDLRARLQVKAPPRG